MDKSLLADSRFLEIAALEVSKALTSTLDLEKVLNLTVDLLEGMVEADASAIYLKENKITLKNKITRSLNKQEENWLNKLFKSTSLDKYLENRIPQNLTLSINPEIFNEKIQFKSIFLIPIFFEDELRGCILFTASDEDAFSQSNVRVFSLLSNQIAIALKNAQLYEEIENKAEELTNLYEASKILNSTLELKEVLRVIMSFTLQITNVETAYLMLTTEDEKNLKLEIHSGEKLHPKKNFTLSIHNSSDISALTFIQKKPFLINNLPQEYPGTNIEIEGAENIKSVVSVPLIAQQKIIGVLVIAKEEENAFNQDSLRKLSILGSLFAVSIEKAALYEQTKKLSITDGLTEIYNHRYFQEKLSEELKRSERYKNNLSLIIFDIDHFKIINDKYGHANGDLILKGVVEILKKNFRETDFVARYGGEEFAIILPETEMPGALVAAERARISIAKKSFQLPGKKKKIKVTISGGVAAFPKTAKDKKELIEQADNALYLAKENGRNKVYLSDYKIK